MSTPSFPTASNDKGRGDAKSLRPLQFSKSPMPSPLPFIHGLARVKADSSSELNVILAYENLSAALWAMETLTELLQQMSNRAEPRFSAWNFAKLRSAHYCAEATAAALGADLIMIAVANRETLLPSSVKSWLGRCLFHRCNANQAIAALYGRANFYERRPSPHSREIQSPASDPGCEFFAHCSLAEVVNVA
jgi:hypothetical protein